MSHEKQTHRNTFMDRKRVLDAGVCEVKLPFKARDIVQGVEPGPARLIRTE
jgi:hypothetical protein